MQHVVCPKCLNYILASCFRLFLCVYNTMFKDAMSALLYLFCLHFTFLPESGSELYCIDMKNCQI